MKYLAIVLVSAMLAACGGGGPDAPFPQDLGAVGAGKAITLTSGETVEVPAGTVITTHEGNTINILGNKSTYNVTAGSLVSVPLTATGLADNIVTAK